MPATFFSLTLIFFMSLWPATAQINEAFSDGNFTENPSWKGTDSLFQINSLWQLQSKVNGGGTAYMAVKQYEATAWQAWFRIAFNPSTQNMARWYLASSDSNLQNAAQSIYVQLGGSTGNTDSISLWKVIGSNRTCLIPGRPATLGKTNNIVRIRVLYTDSVWQLLTDTGGTHTFLREGFCYDIFQPQPYMGVWFKCTSGNALNFYADDFMAETYRADTAAPRLLNALFIDSIHLLLTFSEPIQLQAKSVVLLQTDTALINQVTADTLLITLQHAIAQDTWQWLQLNQITDTAGNRTDTLLPVLFHSVKPYDILITELMPDPDPPQGLPLVEYAELYNNSKVTLRINQLQWCDAQTCIQLPQINIPSHAYVILCLARDTAMLNSDAIVCGVETWPSLNNTGDSLGLWLGNQKIHGVVYTDSWYKSSSKMGGGYSLEMKNPAQICLEEDNWQASNDATGGTPGKQNSVWQTNPDTLAPAIANALNMNASYIRATLTEKPLNPMQVSFQCLPSVGILQVMAQPDLLTYTIQLTDSLQQDASYTLILQNAYDCSGNQSPDSFPFIAMQPQEASWNDLLIHEVFAATSRKGGAAPAPFVELYNRSNKYIQLKGYSLSDAYTTALLPEYIIQPKSYLVVCAQASDTLFASHLQHLAVTPFPSLNLTDCLWLRNARHAVIHQICYKQEWFDKTAQPQSRSLEMADASVPCAEEENWQAATAVNGATPAAANSISHMLQDKKAPQLLRWFMPAPNELVLVWNESIDSNSCNYIRFEPELNILAKGYYHQNNKTIGLKLASFPQPDTLVYLLADSVRDCAANTQQPYRSAGFGCPQLPRPGDICFNEILFNPVPNAFDYVELFNTSSYTLLLDSLYLKNNASTPETTKITQEGLLLLPHDYLVLTEDASGMNYQQMHPEKVIQTALPSLPDDEGLLLLLTHKGLLIDSLPYSEKQHIPFVMNAEGISLEKINPYAASSIKDNWTSAAEDKGWGTPTLENSAYRNASTADDFTLLQPYFSPDGDGNADFATFLYTIPGSAATGTLRIFDLNGTCIKTICNHVLLGNSGTFYWHGDTDNGTAAGIGNYLVYWERCTSENIITRKKLCLSLTSTF